MMRLFFAVDPDEKLRARFAALIEALRVLAEKRGSRIQWSLPEQLHITLRFLGSTDPARLPEIEAAGLQLASATLPFELILRGVGAFPPKARTPRVFWAAVQDPTSVLVGLASRLDFEMGKLGFKPEDRPYTPHLTLGRFKQGAPFGTWSDEVDPCLIPMGEPLQVGELLLYRSRTLPSGSVYEVIRRFRLGLR